MQNVIFRLPCTISIFAARMPHHPSLKISFSLAGSSLAWSQAQTQQTWTPRCSTILRSLRRTARARLKASPTALTLKWFNQVMANSAVCRLVAQPVQLPLLLCTVCCDIKNFLAIRNGFTFCSGWLHSLTEAFKQILLPSQSALCPSCAP